MEAHVTTIFGHEYSIDPLPPREGQRVMFRVMALLGPSFATLAEALISAKEIMSPLLAVVLAPTPEQREAARKVLNEAEVPASMIDADAVGKAKVKVSEILADMDLSEALASIRLAGTGEALSAALRRLAMEDAELIETLLGTATRDGKPLKNPAHYAEAFTANYWELAAAVYAVLDANGLFRLPST